MTSRALILILLAASAVAASASDGAEPQTIHATAALRDDVRARLQEDYGNLPLSFEANLGQAEGQVTFLSRRPGHTLFLTPEESVLALRKSTGQAEAPATLHIRLINAEVAPQLIGLEPLPGRSHYFLGNDPGRWRTDVPHFGRVRQRSVYPGIDLEYHGSQGYLEYDFVVAPGVDPSVIGLQFDGAKSMMLDAHGDLILRSVAGPLRQRRPLAYQDVDGERRVVPSRYELRDGSTVGFEVGPYDVSRTLVIDPVLDYSTFLGGITRDNGTGVAVDTSGNVYVAGLTAIDFPTVNAFQADPPACCFEHAFVTKFDPAGATLIYSTYLGGDRTDQGFSIAVDQSGNAYVTGLTDSSDFPTVDPVQSANAGSTDVFVTKLDPSGAALVYSTYLGGSDFDLGTDVALDRSGNAFVIGLTNSSDFPTVAPLQATLGGVSDVFITKLDAIPPPAGDDTCQGTSAECTVDADCPFFCDAFPALLCEPDDPGACISGAVGTCAEDFCNPAPLPGAGIAYSTYLGGTGADTGRSIAVDGSGTAYVTGGTGSSDFPTANPLQPASGGGKDAFVARLDAAGSSLLYSTYLGGSGADDGYGIALDGSGRVYVTGETSSSDFPTANAAQPLYAGGFDAFVTKLDVVGSAVFYSTYLGGTAEEVGSSIAVDASGNTFVTGWTESTNFPTVSPVQATFGGGFSDVFVANLEPQGVISFSSYLGGSDTDWGYGVALSGSGVALVTGVTYSSDFPTANAFQPENAGDADVFLAKLLFETPLNQEPTADGGADILIECALAGGVTVNLDGSGSSDPDSTPGTNDDIVLFEWFEDFGLPSEQFLGSGEFLSIPLALGSHAVTLRVTDSGGLVGTDDLIVTVQEGEDLEPPVLSLVLTPESLWPPNHRMVDVHADVTVTDNCTAVTLVLDSITSSEPDDAPGGSDGLTVDDIQDAVTGTADFDFRLRAERDGHGVGRQYLVTYRATDDAGNEATIQGLVEVPHDQGGVEEPLMLLVEETAEGTLEMWDAVPGTLFYSVGRGEVLNLSDVGAHYDLGPLTCVITGSAAPNTIGAEDLDIPALGGIFFYLAAYDDGHHSGFGTESAAKERFVPPGQDGCH